MHQVERRAFRLEVRADAPHRRLEGYAATFGTPADIGGQFTETIRAGCFRSSLAAKTDVLALVDHNVGQLLGRTSSGTLRLVEDRTGLAFEIDVPQTTLGADILALAERGDLGGMSFGFRIVDDHWPDKRTRELRAVDLFDVSVVLAHPAYPATSVQARGRNLVMGFPITALTPAQRRRFVETL